MRLALFCFFGFFGGISALTWAAVDARCESVAEKDSDEIQEKKALSLMEVLAVTLANENQVEILRLDYCIQEGIVRQLAGPFDWVFDSRWTFREAHHAQNSFAGIRTSDKEHERLLSIEASKTSRLGTVFSARAEGRQRGSTVNPLVSGFPDAGTFSLAFQLEQPLLRDFRHSLDASEERAAQHDLCAVRYEALQQIAERLFTVVSQYWEVRSAQDTLEVQRKSRQRVCQLLANTEILIREDELPKADIYQPQAQLSRQHGDVLEAEQALYSSKRDLAFFMGLETCAFILDPEGWELDPYPLTELGQIDEPQLIDSLVPCALEERYDIRAACGRSLAANSRLQGARNSQLPNVNLFASAEASDFHRDDVSDAVFGSYRWHNPQRDLTVGVSLSTPLPNSDARGLTKRRCAELRQAELTLCRAKDQTVAEVRQAVRNHLSLAARLNQAIDNVEKNRNLMENEAIKLKAGSSTLFTLIDFENRLTEAQLLEIQIRRDYAQNLARIRLFTGTLLEASDDLCQIQLQDVTSLPTCLLDCENLATHG